MYDPLVTDDARNVDRERYRKANNERLVKLALVSRAKVLGDVSQNPGSPNSVLNFGNLSRRTTQTAQAYWWVPAGFAVMILLRTILGG